MTDPRYANARTPPYSLDAEQAVLGALMLSDEAYFKISDKVSASDFYRHDHRIIFEAISALKERGQPCDAVTLGEWLERKEQSEAAGGIGYVIEIANNTPGAANIVAYAEIVREKSILRSLMEAGTQIVDDILQPEGRSSEELLQGAEKLVFDIGERGKRGKGSFTPISEALKEAYRAIEFRYSNKGTLNGLDTGFQVGSTGRWSAANGVLRRVHDQDGSVVEVRYSFHQGRLVLHLANRKYSFWSR